MNQATIQTTLTRPKVTNEPRQPKYFMRKTTSGGEKALPRRAKEWVMPWAKPRLAGAVQLDMARVAVGKVAPSPTPSSTRATTSEEKLHTAPMSKVEPAQIKPETV